MTTKLLLIMKCAFGLYFRDQFRTMVSAWMWGGGDKCKHKGNWHVSNTWISKVLGNCNNCNNCSNFRKSHEPPASHAHKSIKIPYSENFKWTFEHRLGTNQFAQFTCTFFLSRSLYFIGKFINYNLRLESIEWFFRCIHADNQISLSIIELFVVFLPSVLICCCNRTHTHT